MRFSQSDLIFNAAIPALLAAGSFAAWKVRRSLSDVEIATIFDYAPWKPGTPAEPFQTASLVGLAVFVIFVVAGIAVALRPKDTSHGSAVWMKRSEAREYARSSNILATPIYAKLGSPKSDGAYLTVPDEFHSLIVAPSGAGKGVGIVLPTLFTYAGSIFCLDVKGENYEKSARARVARGDKVFKFGSDSKLMPPAG